MYCIRYNDCRYNYGGGHREEFRKLYLKLGPIVYQRSLTSISVESEESEESEEYEQSDVTYQQAVVFKNTLQFSYFQMATSNGGVAYIKWPQSNDLSLLDLFNNKTIQSSLSIFFNGVYTLGVTKDQQQNTGSLSYILIALEFARQVNAKKIDPATMIDQMEIRMFHIPYYDRNFFYFFDDLSEQNGWAQIDQVSLQSIAVAMIKYQSPGLAEYLQTTLGISNIDIMSAKMGLKSQKQVYAASFALAFSNFQGLSDNDYAIQIGGMTAEVLNITHLSVHNALISRNLISWKMLQNANQFLKRPQIKNAMRSYAVKASSYEYATLFNNINNGSMISSSIVDLFYEILNPVQSKNLFDKTMFVKDASVIQIWDNGVLNVVGSSQLITPIDGVSQITYALFIQGVSLDQYNSSSGQLPLINEFFLSNPSLCKYYVSRIGYQY